MSECRPSQILRIAAIRLDSSTAAARISATGSGASAWPLAFSVPGVFGLSCGLSVAVSVCWSVVLVASSMTSPSGVLLAAMVARVSRSAPLSTKLISLRTDLRTT